MFCRRRSSSKYLAVPLAVCTACTHYVPPGPNAVGPGAQLRVEFAQPHTVTLLSDSTAPERQVPMQRVEGTWLKKSGDTLEVRLQAAPPTATIGAVQPAAKPVVARFVIDSATKVSVQRFDGGRTALLVLGIGATVAGIAYAVALSNCCGPNF